MTNIIAWIIFGLVAGFIAKLIMPGKDPGGWIITILIGIAGASVGGYIGRVIGIGGGGNSFNIVNMGTAIVGALILLSLYKAIKKPR